MGKRKNIRSNGEWQVEDVTDKSAQATKQTKKTVSIKQVIKSSKPPQNSQEDINKTNKNVPVDNELEHSETDILHEVKLKKTKKLRNVKLEKADEALQETESTKRKKKGMKSKKVESDETKASPSDGDVKVKKVDFVNNEANNETITKQYLDAEEAAVKDEDIDEFCDEIDEEDNKQYENWVKLIEANLHSNSKKTKL